MLRAAKPRTIGRVNRAELARTRTIWCSLMHEERVARDIAHGIDLANPGAHIATSEGAAASFSGTQAASAILPSLRGLVEADWPKIAVVARVRATGSQPGNPGNAFGVCGSALQLGVGVGFDGANVGGTILHNSGAGVAVGMPATQGRWYTVLAQGAPGTNGLIRAWVDGGRVGSPDATAGFGAGPPDEVVLGGMHRASGFLRQFRGDVLWGAVLLGDGDHWVTDEFAADLFASGYPYNLVRADRPLWPAGSAPAQDAVALGAVVGWSATLHAAPAVAASVAPGAVLAVAAGLLAGAATGGVSASAVGALTAATIGVLPGPVSAASAAPAVVVSALASTVAGSASGGASASATGVTLAATAAVLSAPASASSSSGPTRITLATLSIQPGAAAGAAAGSAAGMVAVSTAGVITGLAGASSVASGRVLQSAAQVLAGVATGEASAHAEAPGQVLGIGASLIAEAASASSSAPGVVLTVSWYVSRSATYVDRKTFPLSGLVQSFPLAGQTQIYPLAGRVQG